ncbi:MAG TPA: hypothetical protein VLB85_10630, partial [Acidimicrobiia bacterium]|nr:hypothetical protein [Acidimicrobiia bacterium]
RRMVEEARQGGRPEARRRMEETMATAEAEADGIRHEGVEAAKALVEAAAGSMEPLVVEMLAVLLAPPAEPGK